MSDSQPKRVGASVIPPAQPIGPIPGPGPFPGIGVGPGIGPGICGVPPFFPPPPFPCFPRGIIFDDRLDPPLPPFPDENVSLTAGVAPQTIPATSTASLFLSSAMTSSGGARISGNSIILPVPGRYTLSINITASRSGMSSDGDVMFILNGAVSGSGFIASGNLLSGQTRVYTGSVSLSTQERHASISVLVNNDGGPLQILGGTVSVQHRR